MSRPLNILVLSNCAFDEYQGSGYVIVNTMRCLQANGHALEGYDNTTLPVLKWMRGRANRYRMAMGMAWFVLSKPKRVRQKDLIIFYGAECFAAVWALKNLLKFQGKIILHSNGIEMQVDQAMVQGIISENRYQKFFQWNMHPLFRYAYQNVHLLLTVSAYNGGYAKKEMGLPSEKVAMLEPALHPLFFGMNQTTPSKKNMITYCGGWLAIKGVRSISEGLPEILRQNPDYTLRLIGVGGSFNAAAHFPEEILPRIEVFPYVRDRERLIGLFRESRFFIFPSLADSFGLVVAEALCCGCTVITGSAGIGADLKHREEAWVMAYPSGTALREALDYLLKNPIEANAWAVNGFKRVKNMNWGAYGQRLNLLVEGLCCN